MTIQKSACCVYDFTAPSDCIDVEELKKKLMLLCKKWGFQKEEGKKTGFLHWQGRISIKTKIRLEQLVEKFQNKKFHFSVTSKANRDNLFYVMKEDTRIEGPFCDTDEVIYIPRQIREIKSLYPWQKKVIKISKIWNTRQINVIIDTEGNKGKSILKGYIRCYKLGRVIPFCNNYKDILRMVCDMPTSNFYVIDMPRAIDKEKLNCFYSAIETIKDGYAYDDRYSFKDKNFDSPNIFVLTNHKPDEEYYTNGRWQFWEIRAGVLGATLEPYNTPLYI